MRCVGGACIGIDDYEASRKIVQWVREDRAKTETVTRANENFGSTVRKVNGELNMVRKNLGK